MPWLGITLKYNTWLTRDIKWNASGFYGHFPDLVENVPSMSIIHMHNNPKISLACSVNPSSALFLITHLLSMSITVTNVVCHVLTWMVFMGVPTAVTYTHISYFMLTVFYNVAVYSYVPHNDVSVNDGPHIRRWSHKIIIL